MSSTGFPFMILELTIPSPIPDLAIPVLPKAHLSFGANGAAKASTSLPEVPHAGPSRHSQAHGKAMELDDRPYERSLTKKEKAAVSDSGRNLA